MSPSHLRRAVAALPLVLALGVLTACGSDDGGDSAASTSTSSSSSSSSSAAADTSSGASAAAQTQTLDVTEVDFEVQLDSTDLAAGDYEITLTNNGDATHDLVVEQDGNDIAGSDSVGPGESTTFTVTLGPGDYVFYCSIGNHRTMGMETDVTVS